MSGELKAASWIITLPEPSEPEFPTRLRIQEEYLGAHIAPWLLDAPPAWLASCHSYHFMRYIDAGHEGHEGITIELRVLGTPAAVAAAGIGVDAVLRSHRELGRILRFETKPISDWIAGEAYGGTAVSEAFALFLAASSRLGLELLRAPSTGFAARDAIVNNWLHCLSLTTRGG